MPYHLSHTQRPAMPEQTFDTNAVIGTPNLAPIDITDAALTAAGKYRWLQANGSEIALSDMTIQHLLNLRTYLHRREIKAIQAHEVTLHSGKEPKPSDEGSSATIGLDGITHAGLMVSLELRRRIRESVLNGARGAIARGAIANDGPPSYGARSSDLDDACCVDDEIPFDDRPPVK